MRRAARLLGIHRITVARKLKFLANQARLSQKKYLEQLRAQPVKKLQFDDMETFEHTKLKPLSITLAVTMERKILGFEVSQMPAKGLLAAKSFEKYGPRMDYRQTGMAKLFGSLKKVVHPEAEFQSDQNPQYPPVLKHYFPKAKHVTTPGQRGCIVGQGELKKVRWDPLFCLNHTAAMFRANVNRLVRKTWCTTKLPSALADHLSLYVQYHNEVLTG